MTLMGKIAYTLLVAFAASILTLVAVNWLAPDRDSSSKTPTPVTGVASPTPGPPGSATPTPGPSAGLITMSDVARHSTAASCWIVIEGIVYDITTYIPRHPTDPSVLLAWCGKESTQAWEDKGGIGKPHSARAEAALDTYEIGRLAP